MLNKKEINATLQELEQLEKEVQEGMEEFVNIENELIKFMIDNEITSIEIDGKKYSLDMDV